MGTVNEHIHSEKLRVDHVACSEYVVVLLINLPMMYHRHDMHFPSS